MNFIYNIKNHTILSAIFITTIVEVIVIILRFFKYISYYDYDICYYFHYTLKDDREKMTDKSFSALLSISNEFPEYYDNAALGFAIDQGFAFLGMVFSIIALIISFMCVFCGKKSCSMCLYIFTSFFLHCK